MGVVYTWQWTGAGFLPGVREILRPILLAHGYNLVSEDDGKQVFIRGKLALRTRGFLLRHPSASECLESLKLTVGYVATPVKTRVSFTWESCFEEYFTQRELASCQPLKEWMAEHVKPIRESLNEWHAAAQGESDEE